MDHHRDRLYRLFFREIRGEFYREENGSAEEVARQNDHPRRGGQVRCLHAFLNVYRRKSKYMFPSTLNHKSFIHVGSDIGWSNFTDLSYSFYNSHSKFNQLIFHWECWRSKFFIFMLNYLYVGGVMSDEVIAQIFYFYIFHPKFIWRFFIRSAGQPKTGLVNA